MSETATISDGTPSDFFHNALHALRTLELERVPRVGTRALSVGANGRWYFEWFEQCYGPLDHHIGIEAYEPKPTDLPANVEWVVNTADQMTDVATGSVNVVFAGQTTEHLWADELAGFLLEAHRVLAEDGMVVIDSPNRLVTSSMHWSHGGHTVELSAGEMVELLDLAAFEVIDVRGLWGSVADGRILQLEDGVDDPTVLTRRISVGPDHPDDSFVWWINARRRSSEPRRAELERRVGELFAAHWAVRVNRGLMATPDVDEIEIAVGDTGTLGETMPFVLHGGTWRIAVDLVAGSVDDLEEFAVQVLSPGEFVQQHLPASSAVADGSRLSWTFELPELIFALSLRLTVARAGAPVRVRLPIMVEPVAPDAAVARRWLVSGAQSGGGAA